MRGWALLVAGLLLAAVPSVRAAADEEDPPVVTSIRLSSRAVDAGQTLVVTLGVTDETGIAQVFTEIRGPQDKLRLHSGTRCESGEGRTSADLACPFPLSETLPAGTYEVWAFQANDVLWNSVNQWSPDHFVEDARHELAFTVRSDNHDLEGPVVHAVEVTTPFVGAGSNVTFLTRASDATGLRNVGFSFAHEAGSPGTSGSCLLSGTSGEHRCSLPVPPTFPAGRYKVLTMTTVDVNGVATEGYPGEAPTFLVESSSDDTGVPRLLRLQAPLLPAMRGEEVVVELWADDAEGIASAHMLFANDVGRRYDRQHLPLACGPWTSPQQPMRCMATVPQDFPLGEMRLVVAFLDDPATNQAVWYGPFFENTGQRIPEDGLNRTRFWVGPRPLSDAGLPSVIGFEPQSADVGAGSVLPIVVGLGGVADVETLSFSFLSAAGDRLGALGCEPGARVEATGFLCGLILPPGTEPGQYVLDEVLLARPDGSTTTLGLPADPPSFEVTASPEADLGAPLPEDWDGLVDGGYTLASFNSGAGLAPLRPLQPATPAGGPGDDPARDAPGAAETDGSDGRKADGGHSSDPAPEDGGDGGNGGDAGLEPSRPAPAGPAALLAVALLALLRGRPSQRR